MGLLKEIWAYIQKNVLYKESNQHSVFHFASYLNALSKKSSVTKQLTIACVRMQLDKEKHILKIQKHIQTNM